VLVLSGGEIPEVVRNSCQTEHLDIWRDLGQNLNDLRDYPPGRSEYDSLYIIPSGNRGGGVSI
jgi:hypothetical protein